MALALVVLGFGAVFPGVARAHAFLVRVTPADRSVLARAPREVRLEFTEPVLPGPGIAAIRNGGGSVLAGKASAENRSLVIALRPGLRNGAYTVRWLAISDDGHEIGGVIAFGVGAGRGPPLPGLDAGSTGPGTGQYLSRWLFLIGLLVASGVAVFDLLVWRLGVADAELSRGEREAVDRRGREGGSLLLIAGFAATIVGGLLLLWSTHASFSTRFGRVVEIGLVISAVGAVAALASFVLPFSRPVALVAALALLPVPTLSGHALDAGRSRLDLIVDVAHVSAAAVWLGGLLALAALLPWAGRPLLHEAGERLLFPLARRFSALALAAVVLLAGTGIGRALEELASVSQLWSIGYGRALLVKTALLVALLVLAIRNRFFLLRGPFARLRAGVAGEAVVLVGLVVAVAVLTALPPGWNTAAAAKRVPTATPAIRGEPPEPPPPGAVVLARQKGRLGVALAVVPVSGRRVRLTATVVGPDRNGVNGLAVAFASNGAQIPARPCGSGCYTAFSRLPRRTVTVALSGRSGSAVAFQLPERWPVPSASELVRRATSVYLRLHSVSYLERLASGPAVKIVSFWKQAAPNRFQYRIRAGPAGIVIGGTRWDKTSLGARWVRSEIQPLRMPVPMWGERPTNAHLLRTELVHGRPVSVVSLFDPSIRAWFTIRFARRTLHPLSLDMTAAAHFMHHDYLSFDRPLKIVPPG